ncbi:MAG TPA: prefoldin subunit beta, partial [Methanobacterium subterraneum]|nr:prefoldin subunit beta [Methanobacterium subterraneum]
EVYKTAGNLLIKVPKPELTEEMTEKLETLQLREKTVARQEERVMKRLQEMQESLQESMQMQPGMGN